MLSHGQILPLLGTFGCQQLFWSKGFPSHHIHYSAVAHDSDASDDASDSSSASCVSTDGSSDGPSEAGSSAALGQPHADRIPRKHSGERLRKAGQMALAALLLDSGLVDKVFAVLLVGKKAATELATDAWPSWTREGKPK